MLKDYFNRKNKILLIVFLVYNIMLLSFMHISFNKSKKDYIKEHNIISYKFFKVNEKTENVENVENEEGKEKKNNNYFFLAKSSMFGRSQVELITVGD